MLEPLQGVFSFCNNQPVRPARAERLFFAVFPKAETARRIGESAARLLGKEHFEGHWIRADRLHVSLHHIGDYKRLPTKLIYAAREAGDTIRIRPFEISFHAIRSFEGVPANSARQRPVVLLGEANSLRSLHEALGCALEKQGLRPATYFTPHLTFVYGCKLVCSRQIEPIRFTIDELALVHSRLGLGQYEFIGRWPLRA